MVKRLIHVAFGVGLLFSFSCKNGTRKSHGAIVLGDSSTIITENDTAKLQDLVADLNPVIKSSEPADTPAAQPAKTDTPQKTATPAVAGVPKPDVALSGNGLKADFKVMTAMIPNMAGKQAGNGN